ncbi:efflux RND transporter periplasmic adaptor subunit [Polyangium mundeleinium]|uniref:Efflux RND transporter periplasmic adaptor subunit n=1 Tax=Polyangium mundeleinium TaxID=2995306 RepID=A0ABT5EXB6_9BACT|nr:efflux RND transporter periplasmic adaptor subunit [Polyangium mundeleinium]MDC0745833.1 efflux RND transporter periplasmic adaptor subunit [Polyangium mundeleinium]
MRPLLVALLALLLGLAGCGRDPKASPAGPASSTQPASAKADGEGKLCAHGVLDVVCPKCHPKLAAVFQAKGDWCAEHGFPASFCPVCHPTRGGRPAADVSGKSGGKSAPEAEAPADGTKVRFKTKETARLAGIQTVKAEERKNAGGILVTARVVYDATRLAHINARAPGVVRAMKVDIGSQVKKRDALAVLDSAEVGADRSKLQAARARVGIAQKNHERLAALQKSGFSSEKDVLAAEQELETAKAEQAALATALSIIGAGAGAGGSYTLTSPIDGVVTQRSATVGKLVGLEEMLFEVVDTSAMWAELDVPEAELAAVAVGQSVTLDVDGLVGRTFRGKITYLSPQIDLATRTVRARVPLENVDGVLRGNMFGRARVDVGAARASVMVPDAAVQRAKDVHLVFIRLAEDEYEARRVEMGLREGNLVEIRKGIRPGEDVATTGSFLLKTETLKESIGAGCCDAD